MQLKFKLIVVIFVLALSALVLRLVFDIGARDMAEKRDVTAEKTVTSALPPVTLKRVRRGAELPAFAEIRDIPTRKTEFFNFLMPAIEEQNTLILQQRNQLERLHEMHRSGAQISSRENRWLSELALHYRVETTNRSEMFATLLRRVDVIPDTLVLIQAANESGWGTSRFAREANNLFGEWCWSPGCGIVPNSRPEGQIYEVRKFESVTASVRSYIRNLNTHHAYQDLRQIRADLRTDGKQVTAQPLTHGLMAYSERGEDYIHELNQMIRVNLPIIRDVRETFNEGTLQAQVQ